MGDWDGPRLICPLCEDTRATMRALYWHLRIEHGSDHGDAYDMVGSCDFQYPVGRVARKPPMPGMGQGEGPWGPRPEL